MPQHRLQYYFVPSRTPTAPSGRSFLDFPHSVRKLVYTHAGLEGLVVDLNYSNLKVYPYEAYPATDDCRKLDRVGSYELRKLDVADPQEVWEIENGGEDVKEYGRPLWGNAWGAAQSMLLVSRKIHEEVEAFIYAKSVFRICMGQPLGLTRLWRMSDHALSNLRSLTIRLDAAKTEVENSGWQNDYHDNGAPPIHLDFTKKWGTIILEKWTSILERLINIIRPGQLSLRVIFNAKMMSDAKAIIESMMRLPLLKDCGICAEVENQRIWWRQDPYFRNIGRIRYRQPKPKDDDTELSRLIQKVIRELTSAADREVFTPFRFLGLPQELRFAILEFTDLISPEAVQWRPRKSIDDSPSCTFCISPDIRPVNQSRPPCTCHLSPGGIVDRGYPWYRCCQTCNSGDASGFCYCSTPSRLWSSACTCPLSRHRLFAVSRQFRHDAMAVYYGSNSIIVTPFNSEVLVAEDWFEDALPPHGVHHMPKIELSLYLSSIAPDALQHIRRLEWILPSSQQSYLLPSTPAWYDYLDTVQLMERAMEMSALTLTINFAASGTCRASYDTVWCGSCVRMPLDESAWSWYRTIVLPVRRLGDAGLKNFFVHLRWRDVEEGERKRREQDLERAVMGERYNSAKRGKPIEFGYKRFLEHRAWQERSRLKWLASQL